MERTYRIHMASEMTGVSEGLIRAWERRYGVLKPKRTASGYRAYTQADIEVLRRLKKLTEEGVAIAEAVRLLPTIKREAKQHVSTMEAPRRPPEVDRWRDEVLAAAERLDQQAIEAVLDQAMACMPPVAFFEDFLTPLQREVGARWHDGRLSVGQEHLVTQAARQRVVALLHQAPKRARRHVVCACFPGEDHELGLLGAALRFRHAGWRVTFLGARTPAEHLGSVVRALKPDLVALSAAVETVAGVRATLGALPPGVKVVVGGAAAQKLSATLGELGARVVESEADWVQVLA